MGDGASAGRKIEFGFRVPGRLPQLFALGSPYHCIPFYHCCTPQCCVQLFSRPWAERVGACTTPLCCPRWSRAFPGVQERAWTWVLLVVTVTCGSMRCHLQVNCRTVASRLPPPTSPRQILDQDDIICRSGFQAGAEQKPWVGPGVLGYCSHSLWLLSSELEAGF